MTTSTRHVTAPRLVATDLDGTVVRSDGTISARTVAAFARVEAAGAHFVLVTGRPPRWIHPVAESFGHRGLALCANGALVYDLHSERVIQSHMIQPEVLEKLVELLREAIPGVTFGVEYEDGVAFEHAYELGRWSAAAENLRASPEELVSRPGAKLLARHPTLCADDLLAAARPAVGDLATPTHSNGDRLLELSAAGVSKASALAELSEGLGIAPHEVIAFGDMPNDLTMLAWAGTAYAVANAHPEVLAAVPDHAAANDADGVAQILERLYP
ncbi:MAG: Cof-type HAD-IIB family hydrolase [Streptosporangiales bacterium]|nr:Cof-type HAD-IIB family hydrolase [Streptosporangiales bacterium]